MARYRTWHVPFARGLAVVCALALFARPSPGQEWYELTYSTYFGGSAYEQLREVIPLPDGSVLVGGQTHSDDLPVTPGVVQGTYAGEPAGTGNPGVYCGDCVLARISPDGSQVQTATYFGGARQERRGLSGAAEATSCAPLDS